MKIRNVFLGLFLLAIATLLCSCVAIGTKIETPSDKTLVLGKLTPAEAFKQFGKPYATINKATKDGVFLTYKYEFAVLSFGTVSSRVLLLEFKNDALNGYFWWSSFKQDHTTVSTNSFDKLKGGIGKLTKEDVLAAVGKPNGKGYCPSMIEDFKDNCDKNAEIWAWYMEERTQVNSTTSPKSQELIVTFDADGKVSGLQNTDVDNLRTTRY